MIRTSRFANGQLFIVAGYSNNFGPHQFAQFNRSQPNTARGTKNQQALARFQMCLVIKANMAGAVGNKESSRIDSIHVIGQWDTNVRRHRCIFRQTTKARIGSNLLTHF